MLYHYYIIIVTLKNNNNLINLIKTSTDAWSDFLTVNCQAAYAALMSPLKAEVLQQVPTCAAWKISPKTLYFPSHLLGYLAVSLNKLLWSLAQNPLLHKTDAGLCYSMLNVKILF